MNYEKMTLEELNELLHRKAEEEQQKFREDLLSLPASEILSRAYEYNIREDILLSFDDVFLSAEQCRALLSQDEPLAALFEAWTNLENKHMEEIRDLIEGHARAMLQHEHDKEMWKGV